MSNETEEKFEGTVEEQLEKVKAALDRAKKEAKERRETVEALTAEIETLKAAPNEYKNEVIRLRAEKELAGMGFKDADTLLKYVPLDDVAIEEGKLVGFKEKVDAAKKEIPELFDLKKRVANAADSHATGDSPKRDPLADQVNKALNNR